MSLAKKMDHNAYIARTRKMEDASLRYVRDDARQAIEAMPDGPNAGYYADEMHYCEMEIASCVASSSRTIVTLATMPSPTSKNATSPTTDFALKGFVAFIALSLRVSGFESAQLYAADRQNGSGLLSATVFCGTAGIWHNILW